MPDKQSVAEKIGIIITSRKSSIDEDVGLINRYRDSMDDWDHAALMLVAAIKQQSITMAEQMGYYFNENGEREY